jgi:hypothetical protein
MYVAINIERSRFVIFLFRRIVYRASPRGNLRKV